MKKLFTLIMSLILGVTACLGLTACGKQFTGFDIELATEVLDYVNQKNNTSLRIEFQEIDWNSKEALLENGTIDLVWNGMTITPARQEQMCISIPYLYSFSMERLILYPHLYNRKHLKSSTQLLHK